MCKRILFLAFINIILVSAIFSFTYYLDIAKDEILKSEADSNISFDKRNAVVPNPKMDIIIEEVNDLIFRFDLLNDNLFYIKYNNQQVIRHNLKNNTSEAVFSKPNKIITDITIHEERLFVSIIPHGKIYVYNGEKFELFYSSDAKYIWDIEATPFGLAIITGNPAKMKVLDENGKETQSYFLADINGSIIRYNPSNRKLYAGTANNGLIYSFDLDKKTGNAIYQNSRSRIINIDFGDSGIYFAEVSVYRTPSRQQRQTHVVSVSAQDPVQDQDYNQASAESAQQFQQYIQPERMVSAIYYLNEHDKIIESVYSQLEIIYDFAVFDDSILILSDKTSLISVNKKNFNDIKYSYFDIDSMLYFLKRNGKYYISSGFPGNIYRFYSKEYSKGEWISKVYSMNSFVEFGKLNFNSDKNSKLSIRAGNSMIPDDNWTKWHTYSQAEDLGFLPKSMFFQVKLEISGHPDAYMKDIRVFFRSIAIDCIIKDIKINKDLMIFGNQSARQRQQSFASGGMSGFNRVHPFDKEKPVNISWNYESAEACGEMIKIIVNIRDFSSDRLIFQDTVFNANRYELDKSFFPDGRYYAEIIPDSIYPSESNASSYISNPFTIDNTPPTAIIKEYRKDRILIEAEDKSSILALAYIECMENNKKYILPQDKIFDSRKETFIIKRELLDGLCMFSVYDLEGNKTSILLQGKVKNDES